MRSGPFKLLRSGGSRQSPIHAISNVYFHIMAAYAILRHNGVEVGKTDFLGPINWVKA
jgi:hypothetical protein